MDLNTKPGNQTFNQTKQKLLTLEARHTLSIEASNKIRSKLRPRLFIPRTPVCRLKTRSKYSRKELNATNLKSDLKTFKERPKEDLSKRKYTKKPSPCDKCYKIIEGRSRCQSIKMPRKTKRIKFSEHKRQNRANLATTANEVLINWYNPTATVSTRYLTNDNDVGPLNKDPLAINSPKLLHKGSTDDNTSASQNLQTKKDKSLKRLAAKNSLEQINQNMKSLSFQNAFEQSSKAKEDLQTRVSENFLQCKTKDCNRFKTNEKDNEEIKEKASARKNKSNKFLSDYLTHVTQGTEVTVEENLKNNPNLKNDVVEKFSVKSSSENNNNEGKGVVPKYNTVDEKSKQPTVANTEKPASSSLINNNQNLTNKESTKQIVSETSPTKMKIENVLTSITTGLTDLQDSVRSSISLIYDCSPIDKKINEDLVNMENSIEQFSKYLLQRYNDVNDEQLKTNQCIEYLRRKDIERRTQLRENRSPPVNSTLNKPAKQTEVTTTETVTIFIEAYDMPIGSITYKTADILHPQINSENSVLSLESNCQPMANVKRKCSNENATMDTIDLTNASTLVDDGNIEIQHRNDNSLKNYRRKRQPRILKKSTTTLNSCLTDTHAPASAVTEVTYNAYEQDCPQTTMTKHPVYEYNYDLQRTTAANSLNSHPQSAITKSYSSLTSQVLTESPPALAVNRYSYTPSTRYVNAGGSMQLKLLKSYSPHSHLYPFSQNSNGAQTISPPTLSPPTLSPNYFVYHQNAHLLRVPYLQNHYNETEARDLYMAAHENFQGGNN